MENLLHERLRKHNGGKHHFTVNSTWGILIAEQAAQELADEIERYYIPRPRFEDGEPVQFGDLFAGNNGEECVLTSVFVDLDGFYKLNSCPEYYELHLKDLHHHAKRPTPKVYDADGVETKAGDKGFDVTDGCPLEAVGINGDDEYCLQVRYPNSTQTFHIMPERFTHELPVFDAEGLRICEGDMVWPTDSPDMKMTVDNFQHIYGQDVTVNCEFEGKFYNFNPDKLTHREPDSLEKLQDFLGALANRYSSNVDLMSQLDKAYDMCTALIERGA